MKKLIIVYGGEKLLKDLETISAYTESTYWLKCLDLKKISMSDTVPLKTYLEILNTAQLFQLL